VFIEDLDVFQGHYVLTLFRGGLPQLRVVGLADGQAKEIAFPEPSYSLFPEANPELDTTKFRFQYSSFVTPRSVYDYDVATGEKTLLKEIEVPNYDRTRYQTERISAKAKDGTEVPISLVYKKGLKRDGRAPVLLYAYGSYGIPMFAGFDSNKFSLLDRGVVYAVAHIRGGGELGKKWHDDGRMLTKKNTFTDFIAAAEHLVAQKYTSSDRLVVMGGSAGGLLIGAVVNMRPDLFKAALALVPFVDVINTMLDETLPLTINEFEEWGNPKKKDEFDYMLTYSPYENVAHKAYPSLLVESSLNDSQVMYWEPAKWVAKLRANKTDKNPLLFNIRLVEAGHGGASGRYDRLREDAFRQAFVLWQVGIRS
jgi:oligopeptidase B